MYRDFGHDWALYVWPGAERPRGFILPASPQAGATDCIGLNTDSAKASCDLNEIPRRALVIAHSTPISGSHRFLFYGAVDARAARLVFRFADGSTMDQTLFEVPRWASRYKFFVAPPPPKGTLGNFDPIVYDAQGRELRPGK